MSMSANKKVAKEAQPLPGIRPSPFKLVESKTHHITKDEALRLAQHHQTLPHSPTERELDPKRVAELLVRVQAGLLLPCNWATVLYQGVKYRMNGQHSSTAILEAAEYLPDRLAIHLDHYETDSAEGMGALFRQFDARFSGRTKQDVAGAYQGLVKALEGVSRRKAKLGIEGISWYRRNIEGLPVPGGDDLYSEFMVEGYHPFLRWMDKILTIKTPELERAPVVGAMYATFNASESGAQEFWFHTAKNDLNDDNDPRSVLCADLVHAREQKGQTPAPTPAEFYAKCIKAWNAFRSGEKVRTLNVNTKKGLPSIAA